MLLALILLAADAARAADHPLDPLSAEELRTTVDILKSSGKTSPASRFSLIELQEPPKDEVLNFKPGGDFRRESFTVVYERDNNKTYEAVVDLKGKKLLSWRDVPGVQPSFLEDDLVILQHAVRADPRFKEAMAKRGITELKQVEIDDWAGGYFGDTAMDGPRIRIAVFKYMAPPKHLVGRDIDGVVAYVDLNAKKVIKFIDTGVVPIPQGTPGFDNESIGKKREAPKPLIISQPEGASFELRGNEVRWQRWRFRFALNGREGLVLSTVGYEDRDRVRSVLYRGSLSEMVVPYGDPSPGWFIKNAFDEGEDSMGRYTSPLTLGTDVPLNAKLFDAVLADEVGKPFTIPRAVALYERDGGVLWHHYNRGATSSASRRSRELVLGWIATVGNYDYCFNWVFHQDGKIEMEVLLAGFVDTKAVSTTSGMSHDPADMYGHLVAPNISAIYHQHFFSFRLDLDVDGKLNSVAEMNTEAEPDGPSNPQKNAFLMKESLLRSEQDAMRQLNLASSRTWKFFNPGVKSPLDHPVGYMLMPGENSLPYAAPDSWIRKRAGFMNAHVWVTPYDPKQIFSAGFYANQSKGEDGLPRWVEANRSIENQDIVLWYTLGVTHMPRPEEWPIMPVHRASFMLVPCDFFDRNPALDVP